MEILALKWNMYTFESIYHTFREFRTGRPNVVNSRRRSVGSCEEGTSPLRGACDEGLTSIPVLSLLTVYWLQLAKLKLGGWINMPEPG